MELTNKDGKLYVLLEKEEFMKMSEPFLQAGTDHMQLINRMEAQQRQLRTAQEIEKHRLEKVFQERLENQKRTWFSKVLGYPQKDKNVIKP